MPLADGGDLLIAIEHTETAFALIEHAGSRDIEPRDIAVHYLLELARLILPENRRGANDEFDPVATLANPGQSEPIHPILLTQRDLLRGHVSETRVAQTSHSILPYSYYPA